MEVTILTILLAAICVMAVTEGSAISAVRNVREANPSYEIPPHLPSPTLWPPLRLARAADEDLDPLAEAVYMFLPSWVPHVRFVRDVSPSGEASVARVAREAVPDNERPPYLPRPTFQPPARVVRAADPGNDRLYPGRFRRQPPTTTYTSYLCDLRPGYLPFSCWT